MARYAIKSFKAHGYCYDGSKQIEIQISRTGEAARYKITQNFTTHMAVFYGYWQEIRYSKRGRAFIRNWSNYHKTKRHTRLYLDHFMRFYAYMLKPPK